MRYRTIGVEVGVFDPHPMQDDTDAARQRDHCPLRFTPTGNLCRPCSEPSRAATIHHDRRSLVKGAPEIDIACLGDPARDIALTRLVSRGCQADPRPDLLRRGEPAGVIPDYKITKVDDLLAPECWGVPKFAHRLRTPVIQKTEEMFNSFDEMPLKNTD